MISGGNPCGKSGNGLSRWMPAISQCPVVVSLPGEASVARPNAPSGATAGASPVERLDIRQTQPAQIRQMQRTLARDIAQRVAALVAIGRRIRHLADADAIEHDPDDAAEAHAESLLDFGRARDRSARSTAPRTGPGEIRSCGSKPCHACSSRSVVGICETCSSRVRPSSKYTLWSHFCSARNGATREWSSSVSSDKKTTSSRFL